MSTENRHKLKKFINELKAIRGRHTELVSVYVPAGYDMNKIINHLAQEQGTAANIKDKNTRNNVIDSLERMIRHLRLYKETPVNGLAAFAGNVSAQEGKTDLKVWSIEPPQPLMMRLYRCDQTFVLDELEKMLESRHTFGLIVIDKRDAALGLLKGTSIVMLRDFTSNVPGKTTKGGQCCILGTIVELNNGKKLKIEDINIGDKVKSYDFNKKIFNYSEVLDKWMVEKDEFYIINDNLKCSKDHLIFLKDGSVKAAEQLNKNDILLNENAKEIKINSIKKINKKVKMIDLSVKNKNFIANCVIVHNSQQRYARLRDIAAHEFYQRVAEVANKEFMGIKDLKGILVGGPGMTKETFVHGNYLFTDLKNKVIGIKDLSYTGEFGLDELVEKSKDVLVQEEVTKEKELVQEFFNKVAKEEEKSAYGKDEVRKALEMGAVQKLLISEAFDEIDAFEDLAEASGAEVFIISTETREGVQLRDIGGIAAILRFAIN